MINVGRDKKRNHLYEAPVSSCRWDSSSSVMLSAVIEDCIAKGIRSR